MSCYIVDDNTIQYICNMIKDNNPMWATYMGRYLNKDILEQDPTMDDIIKILLEENYKSYNAMYKEGGEAPPLKFKKLIYSNTSPEQLLGAICNYDYQACEHKDYEKSQAYKIVQYVKDIAISKITSKDNVKWGAPDPNLNAIDIMNMIPK